MKKDYAYISETGMLILLSVLSRLWKLSGKSIEQLRVGHRISIDEKKRDPSTLYFGRVQSRVNRMMLSGNLLLVQVGLVGI